MDSLEQAMALKRWMGERHDGLVCFDTETTGIEYGIFADTRLVQIGDERTGWAIPAQDWTGLVRELFSQWRGPLGAHNAKYDQHMLKRLCGVELVQVHDTMIQCHLDDPLARKALKKAAARLVDKRAGMLDDRLSACFAEHKWDWATVPTDFPPYWSYAAVDAVLTSRLHSVLYPRLRARGQDELYQIELSAQTVCAKMEERGIMVDVGYCTGQRAALLEKLDRLRAWCRQEYGFELGQRQKVAARLVRDGWEPTVFTPATGDPSLAGTSLEGVDHPLARAWTARNDLTVRANNYFANLIRYGATGTIHPTINPLEAKTGRMSVQQPSLHNQPRSREVRGAFVARPGHRLIAADFAQIELRLAAHFSREPAMCGFFREGRDMPTEVARTVFGLGASAEVPKDMRQRVKSTLYSLLYGAGTGKVATVLGVGIDEARVFIDSLFAQYPRIPAFFKDVARTALDRDRRRPWVQTPLKRRLQVRSPDEVYKLVNYLIQAEAGIAFKRQMIALDAVGLSEWMVIPVHDEVVCDVPLEHVEEVRNLLAANMPDTGRYRVPLTVEVGAPLERWGDAYADHSGS